MFALGVAHETGQGFQGRSLARAKTWYRKSASLGYVDAMREARHNLAALQGGWSAWLRRRF